MKPAHVGSLLAGLVVMTVGLVGCAEHTAQRNVQITLNALAEGVVVADDTVEPLYAEAADEAREEASSLDDYFARMESWDAAEEALRVADDALRLGQAALDIWVETGSPPLSWDTTCDAIGAAIQAVLDALEAVGVDVPSKLSAVAPQAGPLCRIVAAYVTE